MASSKKKNNESSIIRNIWKDSYIRNLKLLDKSKSASKNIKTQKDLKSYVKSIGINTYENFIKKFPEVLYTLILVDNELNITTDDVYKTILSGENIPPFKRLEYLIRNLNKEIQYNPGNIFKLLKSYDELMKLRHAFTKNKSVIDYKNKYVWANVIVWLIKMTNSADKISFEDSLYYLIDKFNKQPNSLTQKKINELYLLLDIWSCSAMGDCSSTTQATFLQRRTNFMDYIDNRRKSVP